MRRPLRLASVLCAAAVVCSTPALAQNRIAISAPWGVGPDGSLMKDVTVVIADGRIERVVQGPAEVKTDRQYRFEAGVICPGLIDLASTLGVAGTSGTQRTAVEPEMSVVEALDAYAPALLEANRCGVTSVMIAPPSAGFISGACATVRTAAPQGVERIIRADGPLAITLGSSSWDPELGMSSRAGVLQQLRDELRSARSAGGASRLARAARGELDVIVDAETAEDVDAAIQLWGQFGVTPTIHHNADLVETADELAESGGVVVVGPYTFSSDIRLLSGPAMAGKAGCEVAFRGGLPFLEADALRVTAALAVRYGLDPAAARRGLTINAARAAGLGNRVGALTPGSDADIVIFSDDPLRLDARVLEVWVGGSRVHHAQPASSEEEDAWKAW